MNAIAKMLKDKGLKVTPQRIAVYNVLKNTKEHPNAETVYESLIPTNPTISLATVYKTLDLFCDVNLVNHVNTGEGFARYDADISSHPHAVCTVCGKVTDLPAEEFTMLAQTAASSTGYELESVQLTFYGKCPDCQKVN